MKKPIQLRIIFILNALMMVLPFIFYAVFTAKNVQIEGFNPVWMIYTGIGYIVSFALLVFFILKKQFVAFRIMFAINVLISIPASAYIGIVVAIVSFVLSFSNKVKAFFTENQLVTT